MPRRCAIGEAGVQKEHIHSNTSPRGCNVKERPIILSTEAVNGFLEGRKTQYRSPANDEIRYNTLSDITFYNEGIVDANNRYFGYPFGPVFDRVWVRESFRSLGVQYKSDGKKIITKENNRGGWESPIHMPRWASRLSMDIRAVRLEMLQSITDLDAMAEGCDLFSFPEYWNKKTNNKLNHWACNPLVFVTTFEVI